MTRALGRIAAVLALPLIGCSFYPDPSTTKTAGGFVGAVFGIHAYSPSGPGKE